MSFEDHFSRSAAAYARYRPRYPAELFAYLASQSPGRTLAWDVATGSGQAALGLAEHFERVIATDASAEQIARAAPHPRITYLVEPAEQTRLDPGSVDLVTAAVAVHWFDFERFYAEVRRTARDGAILAVWTYSRPQVSSLVDPLLARFDEEILEDYWPERIRYLRERYRTLPFPFEELAPPAFAIQAEWTLDQLIGFLDTWSAVRRYQQDHDHHPLQPVWDELLSAWGDPDTPRTICWQLYLRVGRV